mmetsp:Transcript_33249/g.68377  ORF Transcript_33249/g.68377 Transcript_33249/m.68377 type:complete len:316 (-) Transcript_33249:729-1676(-)
MISLIRILFVHHHFLALPPILLDDKPTSLPIKLTLDRDSDPRPATGVIIPPFVDENQMHFLPVTPIIRNDLPVQREEERIADAQRFEIPILHRFMHHDGGEVGVGRVGGPGYFPREFSGPDRRSGAVAGDGSPGVESSQSIQHRRRRGGVIGGISFDDIRMSRCAFVLLLRLRVLLVLQLQIPQMQKFQKGMQSRLRLLDDVVPQDPLGHRTHFHRETVSAAGTEVHPMFSFGQGVHEDLYVGVSVFGAAGVHDVGGGGGHEGVAFGDDEGDAHVAGGGVEVYDYVCEGCGVGIFFSFVLWNDGVAVDVVGRGRR